MTISRPPEVRDVVASTLRTLGVALFAAIAVLVSFGLRWLILRDDVYSGSNLQLANFMVAISAVVATGALLVVALDLVRWPDRRR